MDNLRRLILELSKYPDLVVKGMAKEMVKAGELPKDNLLVKIKDRRPKPTGTYEDREKAFKDEVAEFRDKYPIAMLREFVDYWTEKDNNGVMLFEKKTTWETSRRLARWAKNNRTTNDNPINSFIRPL